MVTWRTVPPGLTKRNNRLKPLQPDAAPAHETMTITATETQAFDTGLFGGLFSDDNFWPTQPRDVNETGLTESFY